MFIFFDCEHSSEIKLIVETISGICSIQLVGYSNCGGCTTVHTPIEKPLTPLSYLLCTLWCEPCSCSALHKQTLARPIPYSPTGCTQTKGCSLLTSIHFAYLYGRCFSMTCVYTIYVVRSISHVGKVSGSRVWGSDADFSVVITNIQCYTKYLDQECGVVMLTSV